MRPLALLVGAGLLVLLALVSGWPGPIVADDLVQGRLDTALPMPRDGATIRAFVVPRHDGLSEIELQLVRYQVEENEGALLLTLRDDAGAEITRARLPSETLSHNQLYTLRFAPQPFSHNRRYTLEVVAEGASPYSLWGYSLDVDARGDLRVDGARTTARSLRYTTRYRLSLVPALIRLGELAASAGGLTLLASLLILIPGLLALESLPAARGWDVGTRVGVAVALGLALWPLVWLWLSLAGIALDRARIIVLLALAAAALAARRWRGGGRPRVRVRWGDLALLAILGIGLAARLLAIRDLAFPPWVDPVRHALIVRLMVESGLAPGGYEPLLPIPRFPYHYGFHTLPAMLQLIAGGELFTMLLYLGQFLNVLAPLAIYAATRLFGGGRRAALVAALLVALPTFFPAYYATWGRYTQLTGMLVLPPLVALLWRLRERASRAPIALLAAGLLLIHARLFVYLLPFALLVLLFQPRARRALLGAGTFGGLLVAPRLWQLLARGGVVTQAAKGIEGYNAFPTGYFTVGWERPLYTLGGVVAAGVLVAAARRRRWQRGGWPLAPLALLAWVALLFAMLGGERVGLPESLLVNLNSMVITLFFPLAVVIGLGLERLWWVAGRWGPRVDLARHALAGAALAATVLFGVRAQMSIINPVTVLAVEPDRAALEWAAAGLPEDARVAIGAWRWLGTTWAGSDGGGWLLPLAGIQTTTPPPGYEYSAALHDQVAAFNQRATEVEDWADPAAVDWLRAEGITHLFVGARGGFLEPAQLARNPELRMVYEGEGAFIFEILGRAAGGHGGRTHGSARTGGWGSVWRLWGEARERDGAGWGAPGWRSSPG